MSAQPLPVPSTSPRIVDLVIADLQARAIEGEAKYGQPLKAHNGRDQMRDLYEELLDAAQYIRAEMEERQSLVPVKCKCGSRPLLTSPMENDPGWAVYCDNEDCDLTMAPLQTIPLAIRAWNQMQEAK